MESNFKISEKRIYLDNGATSFPKAPGVSAAIVNFIDNIGTNIGRGTYESALSAERIVYETRELICELFNFDKTDNVVFTKNITESLNVLVKGLLKEGDHVITSSVEHNALMRPLVSMTEQGVEFTRVQCDEEGNIDPDMVEGAIQSNTKVIFMTHASNVCGTILNLEAIGEIAEKHNLFFIIDAAQTAGYMPVDMKKLKANAIAFTGHKSLLGPQGIGGFIIDDKLNDVVSPFIEGGTGSASDKEVQPNRLPDKFESGTPNLPGIFGLNASLKYILGRGIEGIRNHEDALVDRFIQGIKGIEGLRLVGKMSSAGRTPVISVDFIHDDNGFEAFELDRNYNISVRVGMHCAPSAHKTLGTYPQGTVRFSLGYANTEEEVDYVIDAIKALMREKGVN